MSKSPKKQIKEKRPFDEMMKGLVSDILKEREQSQAKDARPRTDGKTSTGRSAKTSNTRKKESHADTRPPMRAYIEASLATVMKLAEIERAADLPPGGLIEDFIAGVNNNYFNAPALDNWANYIVDGFNADDGGNLDVEEVRRQLAPVFDRCAERPKSETIIVNLRSSDTGELVASTEWPLALYRAVERDAESKGITLDARLAMLLRDDISETNGALAAGKAVAA